MPRPSASFPDRRSYYDAVLQKKVSPGAAVRVGSSLFRAVPNEKRPDEEFALFGYSPDEMARIREQTPTLGLEPIAAPGDKGDIAEYAPTLEESLAMIRSGKMPEAPAMVEPAPEVQVPGLAENLKGIAQDAGRALSETGIPAKAAGLVGDVAEVISPVPLHPKAPTSIAETLQLIRAGQAPIPAGPAAVTEPTAILEKAGKSVKEAVSGALKVEETPKAGVFSKVLGKLLMAPTEAALGVPPGLLSKIEDAVGEKAISPAGQETLRQAVLSQPFTPSEFQEAIGAEAIFTAGIPMAFQGILKRFPGMAARLGFQEGGEVLRQAVARGVKIPVSADEMKAFITGVGEIDPVVADKLKGVAGEMGSEKFNAALKDVLAGKRKFFIEVPRETLPARKALPGPAGAPQPVVPAAGPSIEESLATIRQRKGLPSPAEAMAGSARRKEAADTFLVMVQDKLDAGVPLSETDKKVIEVLAKEGYDIPNAPIGPKQPIGAVRPPGDGGALAPVAVEPGGQIAQSPGGVVEGKAGPSAVAPAPTAGVEPVAPQGQSPAVGSGAPGPEAGGPGPDTLPRKAGPRRGPAKPPVQPGGDAQKAPAAGPAAPSEGKGLPQEGPKRPAVKVVASEEAVAKIIPKRSTLPVLHSFKVEGGKMLATDLEVFLEKKTDRAPGMYKFVGKDVVKSDAAADEYPLAPDEKNFEPAGTVDRDDLIRNFERVEKAASTDETRFVIQSVALKVEKGKALLVATDGRRLSMSPLDTAKIKDGTYIIRAGAGVADALKALAPGEIEFGVRGTKEGAENLQFKATDGRVVTRAIEGTYPNFEQILPEVETQHTVSRSALEQAIKELKPYAREAAKKASTKHRNAAMIVNIEKKAGGLVLSAGSEGAQKTIELPATETAGPFARPGAGTIVMPIGPGEGQAPATFGRFQVEFLADAVASVRGENVVLGRSQDSLRPFTVSGKAGEKIIPKAKKAPKTKGSYEIDTPGGGEPPTKIARDIEGLPPAIEMPELVEMAQKLLAGKIPRVMESLRKEGARGVFKSGAGGEINLRADIAKDAVGAAKTLAHEIGHAIDWLPDEDLARGNILGRIGSLRKYIKSMIEAMPDQPYKVLTEKERNKIHSQAVNAVLKKMGKTLSQYIADPALKKAVALEVPAVYKERLAAEVARRGLLTRDEVMTELKALNQKWKPFDVKADPKYTEYRYSSPELYADTISVLFNDPALARQEAPKFYKAWFSYVDRKPEVKGVYEQIIERIRSGKVPEVREAGVEGMFEAGERQFAAERLATHKTKRDIVESLRDELIDKNEGVLAWVRKAKREGKTVRPEDSPQYALEEMNYVSSEVKAYLEKYNAIIGDLNKAGLPWRRLGHMLFHERVIGERGALFNPRGFTPETSARQLEYAQKSLGPERWAVLQKAAADFRAARKSLVDLMGESGMFSPELMEKVENNPFYATFDVFSKHVDDAAGGSGVGASIHGQIGTLQEISNPATATLMKDIALIKAIRRNEAARKTVAFLGREFGPAAVRPAKTKWNGRFHEPIRPGKEEGLLAYMEEGKIKAFVVDKWVARVFEHSPAEADAVIDAARLTQKFFREIFTQKNPGFQLFNLWRDFFRAYKNLPGISMAKLAQYYIKSLTPAFRRGFDIPDPLVKEMLDKKMLITVEDKWGLSTDEEQVLAIMDRYFGNRVKEDPTLKGKFLDLFKWVGDVGSAIEAMPKVAGYKYLMEHKAELGLSEKVIAHMIRGQIGSPDFLRKGRKYPYYNTIFMFSNAIKEGWRSDLEVMRERPGEYAWKTAKSNFLPKLLMLGGAAGLMGAGMKDLMDGVPEYDKTNYLVIPLGKTPQGRTVYFRLPQDEAGRFLGGLFWKVLNKSADPQNLVDYMAGQAPTLNPILNVVADTVRYASGRNPYDFFRQRNVIPEQEFEAGGWRSHRLFLKHLANTMGTGIVHTFKTNDLQKVKTELEEGLGFPIVSNVIGRFIKASDYGKSEMIRREVQKSRKETAREKLDERDALVMHLNAVDKPGPADAAKLYGEMVKDGMLRRGRGTSAVGFNEFLKEYNRFAAKREGDPYMNAIVYAKTNEERADLLEYYRKTLPKADYEKLLAQAMGEGLMTAKPLMLSFIEEKKK